MARLSFAGRSLNQVHSLLEVCGRSLLQQTQLSRWTSTLVHKDIEVTMTDSPRPKIHEQVKSPSEIAFGKHFSDHMLLCHWERDGGWEKPRIVPYGDLMLSPTLHALQYATECIEGMKAYYGVDGKIRLFRPMENMKRLKASAKVASLPDFDEIEFLECIKDLIRVDRDWVPKTDSCSLYLRPTFIATDKLIGVWTPQKALLYCIACPVGPFFKTSSLFEPVSLYADPQFVRAWPGGIGEFKMGANYGPTIRIQKVAQSKGCNQVLWLFGDDHQLTEVGTMNIFVHWINENGDPEIATPPLDGTILPGVTRKSLLELGTTWGSHNIAERKITMTDIKRAVAEGRLKEMFGSGTACGVCPISRILYLDEGIPIPTMDTGAAVATRFYTELTDIQCGRLEHNWSMVVE